jgi:hypothetical protein
METDFKQKHGLSDERALEIRNSLIGMPEPNADSNFIEIVEHICRHCSISEKETPAIEELVMVSVY